MKNEKSTYQFTHNFWEHKKVELKKHYPFLSDKDLHFETGKLDELINNLSMKLGTTDRGLRDLIIKL